MRSLVVFCSFGLAIPLIAQQPVIAGAGYSSPVPLPVAPGQLITLFVEGVDLPLPVPVSAPSGVLPNVLAGVSVTYRQGTDRTAPILGVQSVSSCLGIPQPSGSTCGTILEVTAQLPFEMLTLCPLCGRPDIPASIAVTVNGVTGSFLSVQPLADQVHILTACDVASGGSAQSPLTGGLPCPPMITHADGKLVNFSNPAHSGEVLIAYATGLGQTNPAQQTGVPALSAAPAISTFSMDFNYRPNALATKPLPPFGGFMPPMYAGVAPGFVGLYQVNFTVPPLPPGLPNCVDATTIVAYSNVVESNLTVSIGSNFSFDGAGICVQPGS